MKTTEWMIRSIAKVAAVLLFLVAIPVVAQTGDVQLTGTCIDVEDGDLSSTLVWRSDLDGDLGIGSDLDVALTIGTHVLDATCTDSMGGFGQGFVTYTVNAENNPPVVIIISPEDGGCQGPGCP